MQAKMVLSVDEVSIRFGLKAVKGVGENVITAIVEAKEKKMALLNLSMIFVNV